MEGDKSAQDTIRPAMGQIADVPTTPAVAAIPRKTEPGTSDADLARIMTSVGTLVKAGYVQESTEIPQVATNRTEQVAMASKRVTNNPDIVRAPVPLDQPIATTSGVKAPVIPKLQVNCVKLLTANVFCFHNYYRILPIAFCVY